MKRLIAGARVTKDRVELTLPSAFAEHVRVQDFSPTSLGPGEWPEFIYAGRLDSFLDERHTFPHERI